MRGISSLIVPSAVVVVVVVSATAISAGIGQAGAAEDCLAGPNGASPAGQHWYYRIDRATGHHCWYLHAMQRSAHQAHQTSALANETIEHPAPAAPPAARMAVAAGPWPATVEPIPAEAAPIPAEAAPVPPVAAPMPAADPPIASSAPDTDNAPSLPRVASLTVKTIAVRPPGAGTETHSGHGAGAISTAEASTRAYRAAPENKSDPTTFFFLVFGLGIAGFLTAIVVKRFAPQASWLLRPIRTEAEMAWPDEQPTYSDDRPGWPGLRAIIGSRIDRGMVETDHYADERAEAEYERA